MSYDTQPFNRVVQIGSTTFSYDNNGNLKTKAAGNLITTYDYDHENRLMSVHLPTTPPKTIHYRYDALGRRIERTDASTGAWQRYTHDGWEVRSEENSDGSWVSYVNGDEIDDHLLQRRKSPGSQVIYEYYLSDHQGSLRTLTDANGNVVSGSSYDTFGNRTGSAATRFGYTGREHDPDTGLMYYRARWYSPETGRFVSEDPIGLAGGINLYAYVENDPFNFVDPEGMQKSSGLKPLNRGKKKLIKVSRAQLEELINPDPKSPLPSDVVKQIDRGCVGLCSVYQGLGEKFPENAPGTKCYLSFAQANEANKDVLSSLFIFAKQSGWWLRGNRPIPNEKGEVPNDSIYPANFNYIIYFKETNSFVWMNHAKSDEAKGYGPQAGYIGSLESIPADTNTIWCVSRVKK